MLAENAKVLKLQSELADMQRKLEGKTANELGEGSEIDLFEQLKDAFEGDRIQRVPKGVNGADVIHEVIHNGKVCGKIVYDAKNRNAWQNEFVIKLKRRQDRAGRRPCHPVEQQVPQGQGAGALPGRRDRRQPGARGRRSSRSCATSSCACTSCGSATRRASRSRWTSIPSSPPSTASS